MLFERARLRNCDKVSSRDTKVVVLSVLQGVAAIAVYYHLWTGGWLTNSYKLDDPNIINLALAIFEPIAVATVAAYWIGRKAWLLRLLWIFAVMQLIVGFGFLLFLLFFMLTWHPKLM